MLTLQKFVQRNIWKSGARDTKVAMFFLNWTQTFAPFATTWPCEKNKSKLGEACESRKCTRKFGILNIESSWKTKTRSDILSFPHCPVEKNDRALPYECLDVLLAFESWLDKRHHVREQKAHPCKEHLQTIAKSLACPQVLPLSRPRITSLR